MGFLFPDKHDIFVSYSHDDNERFNDWIRQFAEVFEDRFRLALRALTPDTVGEPAYTALRRQIAERQVKLFIDYEGLPSAGALDAAIETEIGRSLFLFVFIGPGYVASEWCEKEFEFFGRRFGNISTNSLNYIQLIFLEPDVIEKLKPGGLAQQTKSKGLYAKAYGKDDRPHPKILVTEDGTGANNPQFMDFVDTIAKTHVDRTVKLWRETNPVVIPAPRQRTVLFAYPQSSLRAQQTAIMNGVNGLGLTTANLSAAEARKENEQAVLAKLREAAILVLLFDDSPFTVLKAQEEMAKSAGTKILWCWLPATSEVETDPDDMAFLAAKKKAAIQRPPSEIPQMIAREVRPSPPPAGTATILIDQTLFDQALADKVKAFIERIWLRDYEPALRLDFRAEDLEVGDESGSNLDALDGVHGIIMVDRSRPDPTVRTRVVWLDGVLQKQPTIPKKSLFVLPPKTKASTLTWPAMVFNGTEDNDDFNVVPADQLQEFLRAVREKATGGGRLNGG